MIKHLWKKFYTFPSIKTSMNMGFTLAEVLITLLIIGVVASLVIPALVNNTNKAEYIAKLKKEYSILQQAFTLIEMDAGGSILYDSNFNSSTGDNMTDSNAMNTFASKLNVIKNCGSGAGCWYASPLKNLGGNEDTPNLEAKWTNNYGKAILTDGTMIRFDINNSNCLTTQGSAPAGSPLYLSGCGDIRIDVNGASGPNKIGIDVFGFYITQNGIYPKGIFNDGYSCDINSTSYVTSDGCSSKILIEGAINY